MPALEQGPARGQGLAPEQVQVQALAQVRAPEQALGQVQAPEQALALALERGLGPEQALALGRVLAPEQALALPQDLPSRSSRCTRRGPSERQRRR